MVGEVLSHGSCEALVDEGFVQVVLIAIRGDDVLRFPARAHAHVNIQIRVVSLNRVESRVRVHWFDHCRVQNTTLLLLVMLRTLTG